MVKRNEKEKKDIGKVKRISAKWLIPVVILFVMLAVVVVNYFSGSKAEAGETVRGRILSQSNDCAHDISHALQLTSASAETVAGVMSGETGLTKADYVRYAKVLKNVQTYCYAVIIADIEGEGYTNDGVAVNIAERDYFTTSDGVGCFITKNDVLLNRRACVITAPYYRNGVTAGSVYAFVSLDQMQDYLSTYQYISNTAFAICDDKGNLQVEIAGHSSLFKDGKYADNLKKASVIDDKAERILSRMEREDSFVFSVAIGEEERTVVNIPMNYQGWQLITVLDKGYVDNQIFKEWSAIRELTGYLGLIALGIILVIVILIIISRLKYLQRSKELADKADTDLLTELNNKIATERKIQEYIDENPDTQCLFFLFDIDNFKKINDTMGHAFGDEVLRSLGQQLRNEFRVTDIIGRTGGDEFILFLKNIKTDEILEKEAARLVNLFHHFQAGEYVKYSATASIGAAVFPRDAKDYQSLYKSADSALYEAKKRGKNRLVFYNDGLEEVTAEQKKETPIESDMR